MRNSILAIALILSMTGCATAMPHKEAVGKEQSASAREAANLYAGLPTTVYSTTMPVGSFDEGVQRGDDAWRNGQFDMALYLYVQALQFDDHNAPVFAKIGAIHESRGNLPLARRAFELAREYAPDDVRYGERLGAIDIALGDDAAALDVLTAANRLAPQRWRVLDGLGQLALRGKDYSQAVQYFEQALQSGPRTASVILHRGQALLLMGASASAERDARSALQAGDLPEAWRVLGEAQALRGNYQDAVESLVHVMDLAHAYEAVGLVALKQQDRETARDYFESATQTSPTYFDTAHRNLALVTAELAQQRRRAGT